jgi:PQQ-dependent catabolism-associated CXXCW motif protein
MRHAGLRAALLLTVLLGAHAPATVPEPAQYWTGPINSPVPATLSGGKVIHAHKLAELLKDRRTVLIDVSNAPRRPQSLPASTPWLPLPHRAIPGALWIPGAGLGEIPTSLDEYYRQRLAVATQNDPDRVVAIYCHKRCWLSWNAARRAIGYGYRHVYWFPEGIEGWRSAHLPTAIITPEPVP